MTTCRWLNFKEGMMFCGKWEKGYRQEIVEDTCKSCKILKLEQGQLCEFIDFGIRNIESYGTIGKRWNQNVDVAISCKKLGKQISDLTECDNCSDRSSEFLSKQVLVETKSLLDSCGFSGPLQEFNDAYNRYIQGDVKGSITASSSSFESTMKSVLAKEGVTLKGTETASGLIEKLVAEGYFLSFLQTTTNAFKNILQGLATVRNKISIAHGQGPSVQQVENSYAEFALHLAGSFNLFIVKRYLERI